MAPSVFPPNVKLQTEAGEPTIAGEFSQKLTPYLSVKNASEKQIKDAAGIRRMAAAESDLTKKAGMLRQAAEIESKARLESREAQNGSEKVVDKFYDDIATKYVNAMTANSQKDYDAELQNWNKNSGFPPFKDAPEKFGPETRSKLKEYAKTLPSPLQDKINEKLKAYRKEKDAEIKSTLEIDQLLAKQRNGWKPLKGEGEDGEPTTLLKPGQEPPKKIAEYFPGISFKGSKSQNEEKKNAINSGALSLNTAEELKKYAQDHPEQLGRQGQVAQNVERYLNSWKGGKSFEEMDDEGQPALVFAKKYAAYLVGYERTLAGGNRAMTVSFQNRFNKLMSQDQFNAKGFENLMNEQMNEVSAAVSSKDPAITGKGLMQYGKDIKKRSSLDFGESSKDTEKPKANAPEAALKFLNSSPTPENKKFFKDKYGYLPEGM
jgi:hypothetical protein